MTNSLPRFLYQLQPNPYFTILTKAHTTPINIPWTHPVPAKPTATQPNLLKDSSHLLDMNVFSRCSLNSVWHKVILHSRIHLHDVPSFTPDIQVTYSSCSWHICRSLPNSKSVGPGVKRKRE